MLLLSGRPRQAAVLDHLLLGTGTLLLQHPDRAAAAPCHAPDAAEWLCSLAALLLQAELFADSAPRLNGPPGMCTWRAAVICRRLAGSSSSRGVRCWAAAQLHLQPLQSRCRVLELLLQPVLCRALEGVLLAPEDTHQQTQQQALGGQS